MALEKISPFSYKEFNLKIERDVLKIVDTLKKECPDFWSNKLKEYHYGKDNYLSGEQRRLEFNKKIHLCKDNTALIKVSNKILEWGKMRPLDSGMGKNLKKSLECLDSLAKGYEVVFGNVRMRVMAF